MKFIISLILIALLSFAACLYLPWWMVAVVAFMVVALIPQSAGKAFLCGFSAVFILWFALSFWMSTNNNHILAHKISLLIIKADSPYMLMIVTGLIGGLVAGFGAITASFIRERKVAIN
ncbi:MAG: hypothetical protein ABJA37_10125 [Ferruginibacter sp.]